MVLSILRHAIAVERGSGHYPGDDRPLTKAGASKMEKAASGIAQVLDRPNLIFTSPLKRASETAGIVASAFGKGTILRTAEELRPGADPQSILDAIVASGDDHIMIVGHEPDLTLLVAHILGATPGGFQLKKGGLMHLSIDQMGQRTTGRLLWHMKPKHLRMLGKEKSE